jgi:hypothetical protein
VDEIIAQSGSWRLVDRHKGGHGWLSLKLEYTGPRRRKPSGKRTWWIGWNGERLLLCQPYGFRHGPWYDDLETLKAACEEFALSTREITSENRGAHTVPALVSLRLTGR